MDLRYTTVTGAVDAGKIKVAAKEAKTKAAAATASAVAGVGAKCLIPGFVFPDGPTDLLGTGAYAEVCTILDEKRKTPLAVKLMKPQDALELDIVNRDAYFLQALRMLISHIFFFSYLSRWLETLEPLMVPKLVTVHRALNQVSMVMEKMSGNLHDLMCETRRQFKNLNPSWNEFQIPAKILRVNSPCFPPKNRFR